MRPAAPARRRHANRVAAALLVAAVFVAGCDDGGPTADAPGDSRPAPTTTTPGGADGATLDVPDLIEAVEPSIVAVLTDRSQGSGVVWSSDGIIVTNAHVVAGARRIEVAFADGQRAAAGLRAADEQTDLAVLDTDRDDLPAATFADDLPRRGEQVVAIGNPLGFENTVTLGIVSGLGRAFPGAAQRAPALIDLIQTDAAISPGNSGGGLIDAHGRVVGINVAYVPPDVGAESLGFAIPAPTVRDVVTELLDHGQVRHAFFGISSAPITPPIAERFELPTDEGILVLAVVADSPAAAAGIRPGDIVTMLDDTTIRTVEDFLAVLRHRDPADVVDVHLLREDTDLTVAVTLTSRP